MPKLPFRSIAVASSAGGKTGLIKNLMLKVFRDCRQSVHNDPTFVEVKKYKKDNMKVDDKKDKIDSDTSAGRNH